MQAVKRLFCERVSRERGIAKNKVSPSNQNHKGRPPSEIFPTFGAAVHGTREIFYALIRASENETPVKNMVQYGKIIYGTIFARIMS